MKDLFLNEKFLYEYVIKDEKLKSSDKLVFLTLAYYKNKENLLSIKEIAKLTKLARKTVINSLKTLEKYNYLFIKRKKGQPSIYYLLFPKTKLNFLSDKNETLENTKDEVEFNKTYQLQKCQKYKVYNIEERIKLLKAQAEWLLKQQKGC
jgi:transcriptional antiterminator